MASNNHASFSKVGLTVILGVLAIAGVLIYLGGIRGERGCFYAESYYRWPVTGLSVGSEVNFRGVKVGEVKEISFIGTKYRFCDAADRQTVYIKIGFTPDMLNMAGDCAPDLFLSQLIAKGLRATVTSSGVTGLSKLSLNMPRADQPLPDTEQISWTPELVCIPPKPSMLESFSDAATQFMNRMKRMDFETAWSNVATVASSMANISRNVDTLVESQKANIDSVFTNLDALTLSLKSFAEQIKTNPSLLLRQSDPVRLKETE